MYHVTTPKIQNEPKLTPPGVILSGTKDPNVQNKPIYPENPVKKAFLQNKPNRLQCCYGEK